MLWGILAGAGLFGLLDGALRLSFPDGGLWREATLVTTTGDLILALLLGLVASGIARARGVPAARPATGFWIGVAVAAVPFSGRFFADEPYGIAVGIVVAAMAPWLGRLTPLSDGAFRWLAVPAPLLLVALIFLPSSPLDRGEPPALPAGLEAAGAAEAPDLLLISVDTLRADRLFALEEHLPVLTGLRERGRWAPYGLSSTNQTVPAHVTMLSGLDALSHGVRHNHDVLDDSVELVSERLRAAGYATAAVVSNGLIRSVMGFGRGFDAFDDTLVASTGRKLSFRRMLAKHTWVGWLLGAEFVNKTLMRSLLAKGERGPGATEGGGAATTEHALAYLRELQEGERPYFLFVHYLDPHHPYKPPADLAGTFFDRESLPDPYRTMPLGGDPMMQRLRADLVEPDAASREAAAKLQDLYDEEILFIDRTLGELLAQVEAGGRPTVVVFTSDHGEHFGEHDLVLHSNSLYEELVRVPFLLAGPGVEPGRMGEAPHLEDIAPTLLSLAGQSTEGFSGRDLSRGPVERRIHFERYSKYLSVREGRWKLIGRLRGETFVPEELYDLETDPAEAVDLLADDGSVADVPYADAAYERLRGAGEAGAARDAARGRGTDELSEEHRALLEELGYVDVDHE